MLLHRLDVRVGITVEQMLELQMRESQLESDLGGGLQRHMPGSQRTGNSQHADDTHHETERHRRQGDEDTSRG